MHAGMGQACWDIAYCPIQYTYSHCTSPPCLVFGCLPAVMPHAYLAFELSYAPGACRGALHGAESIDTDIGALENSKAQN